jgi:hypothetical protein
MRHTRPTLEAAPNPSGLSLSGRDPLDRPERGGVFALGA